MAAFSSSIDPRNHRLLARTVSLVLAAAVAPVALAQEQPPAPAEVDGLEQVVVTGYRVSLEQALEFKRETTAAVDMILAEDIADFPDLNLAESIQRIPGVVIDRVAGEGRQISVRGLSPEFTRVRINGMEALTTTAATDTVGTNRSRSFDFNVFASDLFSAIAVRKTASAEIEEGSLGATVDLFTARPLDSSGTTLSASYQQGYNDLSSETDPRATLVGGWTNDDGNFGAMFSVAYSTRKIFETGSQSGGWERNSNSGADRWGSCPACTTPEQLAAVNSAVHARFPRYVAFEHEQDRLGATATLQWKPVDSATLSLDALYSKLDATRTEPFMEAISFARANAAGRGSTDVRDFYIDAEGTMLYGLFDDVDVRSENRFDDWSTEFTQYSLSWNQEFGERLRLDALIGTSESNLDVKRQTTVILENFDSDNYSYDFRKDDRFPNIVYGFDTTNPANWVLSEMRDRPSTTDNSFDTARIEGGYDLNDTFTLKAGVAWKSYEFDTEEFQRDRVLPIATATCNLGRLAITDADGRVTKFGKGMDLPSGIQNRFFIADVGKMTQRINFYNDSNCFPLVASVNNTRGVEEEDLGYHLQLDWNSELFGVPFRGDIGVRYVETDQTSRGIQTVGNPAVQSPVVVERTYDDTLPALNMVFEPIPDLLLRASYAKVMTRPNLGNLTPGGTINGFATPPTVTYQNPYLDPFRADAYDLSFEWYYLEGALFSVALFKKDIESFTVSTRRSLPWSALGLPDSLLDQVPADPDDIFDVRTIENGDGGDLDGYEVQFQQPFNFLKEVAWLEDFGILANYTHVESEVNFGTAAQPIIRPLNGLSEEAFNATLYYDDRRLMARLSYTYREQFQRNATSRLGNDLDYTESYQGWDFSASYRLTDNFKLSFEALNINEEFRVDRMDSVAGRIENYFGAGTQYYFGLQYTY
jgi:TonB-dependent receptor